MSNGQTPKANTTTDNSRAKKISRLKKWRIAFNEKPPANWLQKINIFAIIGLSLASVSIGVITILNQTRVKGMEDVVKELATIISAGKPSVRLSSVTR
jgi:hypothetical protein